MKYRSLFVLLMGCISDGHAYEVVNHFDLSAMAVQQSIVSVDPQFLSGIGIVDVGRKFPSTYGVNSTDFTDGCLHAKQLSIVSLIACGAEFEDHPGVRALNHFYDPIDGRPLRVRVGSTWQVPGDWIGEPNLTSPDWALQDSGAADAVAGQLFSYRDARQAFYEALTAEDSSARDRAWGATFQSLGQVIHHLQDMAQPQHVRNDQHLSHYVPLLYNPSHYEKYTKEERERVRAMMAGPASAAVYGPSDPGGFRTPREFWKNDRRSGLAEFTNRNFVSAGTNFKLYRGGMVSASVYGSPRPAPGVQNVPVQQLDPPMSQFVLDYCGTQPECTMAFHSTDEDVRNDRASTLSIFDQYVRLRPLAYESLTPDGDPLSYDVDRVFALNRYNFLAAYPLLIPRAVSYSAGLINYFFRGKLEIGAPAEGVYAVVDHNIPEGYTKGIGGFSRVRLRLQNRTPGPDGTVEPMPPGAGELRAVVKYHLNTCYMPDLSGEYGSPGIDWRLCRSTQESVRLSAPQAAPAGLENGVQVSFDFPSPIPINATDIRLQVVYRGRLGEEDDAVVVATRDISEPTYFYAAERHDQWTYAHYPVFTRGLYSWEEWCTQGGMTPAECNDDFGRRVKARFAPQGEYDPAISPSTAGQTRPIAEQTPFAPAFDMGPPVGRYARVAALTELEMPADSPYFTGPYFLYITLTESGITAPEDYVWSWGGVPVTVNQVDPATGALVSSVSYREARGVFFPTALHELYSQGDAADIPPLRPIASTIGF